MAIDAPFPFGGTTRPGRGSSAAHTKLKNEIRLALGRERDLTLWSLVQGIVRGTNKKQYRAGLVPGASDLVGILRMPCGCGRWICIECKTGNASATNEQRLFGSLVQGRGGFWCVVRSLDESWSALDRARKGLSG
jgi:hypothetical protein